MIASFEMSVDRIGIDFPLLYHHTILSGNFGLDTAVPPFAFFQLLDDALRAQQTADAFDQQIEVALQQTRSSIPAENEQVASLIGQSILINVIQ